MMPDSGEGFLVTLAEGFGGEEAEAVAARLRAVPGVGSVRRYSDPADPGAAQRNDARWRESIIHLLDDEGV